MPGITVRNSSCDFNVVETFVSVPGCIFYFKNFIKPKLSEVI